MLKRVLPMVLLTIACGKPVAPPTEPPPAESPQEKDTEGLVTQVCVPHSPPESLREIACNRAKDCGLVTDEYMHICHACIEFYSLATKHSSDDYVRNFISFVPCGTISFHGEEEGILGCYKYHSDVLEKQK